MLASEAIVKVFEFVPPEILKPFASLETEISFIFPVKSPVTLAEIIPAVKLPDPSRATIVLTKLAEVAVVAELATFPTVAICANFVSTIAASDLISSLTIAPLAIFSEVTASAAIFEVVTTPSDRVVEKLPVPVPVTAPVSVIV